MVRFVLVNLSLSILDNSSDNHHLPKKDVFNLALTEPLSMHSHPPPLHLYPRLTGMPWRSLMFPRRMQDTTQQKESSTGMQKHQPKSEAVWHCMQGKQKRAQQPWGQKGRDKWTTCEPVSKSRLLFPRMQRPTQPGWPLQVCVNYSRFTD